MSTQLITHTNKTIDDWRTSTTSKLKAAASRSYNKYKLRSKAVKDRRTDAIERIGISFERHGIFVEKGVGRGRGINSGNANPMPWYNPILEAEVPILADELSLDYADLITRAMIK